MQPNEFNRNYAVTASRESVLATNTVLRNTYLLLGLTLLFSGVTAGIAMATNATMPTGFAGLLLFLGGAYGLMFLTHMCKNSPLGLVCVFAFTGFMGYFLGPLLNAYLAMFQNGSQIIMTALGGTGLIFFGLSAYALTTKKDFSFLTGFIVTGVLVLLIAMVIGIFFQSPIFHLVLSSAFMMLSSAIILWQTSAIIHGGERNYIVATITLYVQIYNLFTSLLHILGALSGDE